MSDEAKPSRSSRPRTRHSFRGAIREVILRRHARGDTLSVRKIIDEVGGGSPKTVLEELAEFTEAVGKGRAVLVGADAVSPAARIPALEDALNDALARERRLQAENDGLRSALEASRKSQLLAEQNVATMLATHQDAQHKLMQGVDDLRQMVAAGKDALPLEMLVTKASNDAAAARAEKGAAESIYWETKHNQLLQKYVDLDNKYRLARSRLAELGEDIE